MLPSLQGLDDIALAVYIIAMIAIGAAFYKRAVLASILWPVDRYPESLFCRQFGHRKKWRIGLTVAVLRSTAPAARWLSPLTDDRRATRPIPTARLQLEITDRVDCVEFLPIFASRFSSLSVGLLKS